MTTTPDPHAAARRLLMTMVVAAGETRDGQPADDLEAVDLTGQPPAQIARWICEAAQPEA